MLNEIEQKKKKFEMHVKESYIHTLNTYVLRFEYFTRIFELYSEHLLDTTYIHTKI